MRSMILCACDISWSAFLFVSFFPRWASTSFMKAFSCPNDAFWFSLASGGYGRA